MKTLTKLTIDHRGQLVTIKGAGIMRFIDLDHIVYLEAEDNYTCFHLSDESTFMICKPMGYYVELLAGQFFRCHRSFLVNKNHVETINSRKGHTLQLSTGKTIPIA